MKANEISNACIDAYRVTCPNVRCIEIDRPGAVYRPLILSCTYTRREYILISERTLGRSETESSAVYATQLRRSRPIHSVRDRHNGHADQNILTSGVPDAPLPRMVSFFRVYLSKANR